MSDHSGEMCLNGACTGTIGADGLCKNCRMPQAASREPERPKRRASGFTPARIALLVLLVAAVVLGLRYDREIVCELAPESETCRQMTIRAAVDVVRGASR